jgi:hypothetical protein
MKVSSCSLLLLLLALPVLAAEHTKAVYIDQVSGLEPFLREALHLDDHFQVVADSGKSDIVVYLEARFPNVHAQRLYYKQTGRSENAVLIAVDRKSDKVIARHTFNYSPERDRRERAAEAFAKALRRHR